MPPLGPMQKKSRVSEQIVAWGYFSLKLGTVLSAVNRGGGVGFFSIHPVFDCLNAFS